MAQKRGLFQTIFGRPRPAGESYSAYKLLSSWESTFIPFTGRAWEINTVRSAVDAFARRASVVKPRHVRRTIDKVEDVPDYIKRILQKSPNPYMTANAFYYKIAASYKIYNNAVIYPVFDSLGRLTALYPINARSFELLEYMGVMYCRFKFATGTSYICEYTDVIHIRRHFLDNDIFGSSNEPLLPVLQTANTFNQSMSKFAELIAVIRGILKISNAVKNEDLNKRRDDFIRDNLRVENNGAGIIVTDSKYEYTNLDSKQTPIPAGQLSYIKEEIYDYFGVNKDIVQNSADPDGNNAFYDGELSPFFDQLTQAFSNGIFSEREKGYGNEILFEGNKLQSANLNDKVAAAKFLIEIGAATLDQILNIFDMPPIGGEEGARRVQSLNVINKQIADAYQLGKNEASTPSKEGAQTETTPPAKEGEKTTEEGT